MMNDISASILIARRRARLNQDQVAEALGLARITIVRAERNPHMVEPATLDRILSFLNPIAEKNLSQMSQTT